MATNNAINLKNAGVVAYDGAGTFSASTLTQYSVLVGGASNAVSSLGTMTDGQLIIGKTGSFNPVLATLTAGTGIAITNEPGKITVDSSGGGLAWTNVTGLSQQLAVNNGYVADSSGLVMFTLPVTAAIGDTIQVVGKGTGLWQINQNNGQTIHDDAISTMPGIQGYLGSTLPYDCVKLICIAANTDFAVVSKTGQLITGVLLSVSMGDSLVYLQSDGSCWACGKNSAGQLGNNTTTGYSSPISVVGNHTFVSIVTYAANGSTSGLKSDGSVWTWGINFNGQLGNNTTTSYSSPISVIGNHSFIQIAAGGNFTCALKSDGSAWGWGFNGNGQLGNNTTTNYSSPISVVGSHEFVQIAGGYLSQYAIKSDGSAWAWGRNLSGQLGNNTTTDYSSPVSVVGEHKFIQIVGGGGSTQTSTYGLKGDGSVWAWGNNGNRQLGDGTITFRSSPVSVIGNHSFIQIAAGNDSLNNAASAYGLKADGSIWAWGDNRFGQLGNNRSSVAGYSSPISVVGGQNFAKLAYGSGGSMAACDQSGRLWTWGLNSSGQLGNNTTVSYSSPILVLSTL